MGATVSVAAAFAYGDMSPEADMARGMDVLDAALLIAQEVPGGVPALAQRMGVEDLTEELVRRYVQRLGGSTVYVRNPRVMERERLAQEVRARFNGRNTRALAREYGVSVRWVQKLLEAAAGA